MLQALLEQGLSWLRWRGKYFTMVLSKSMKNGAGEFTQQLEKLIALAKVLGLIKFPHGGSKPTVNYSSRGCDTCFRFGWSTECMGCTYVHAGKTLSHTETKYTKKLFLKE